MLKYEWQPGFGFHHKAALVSYFFSPPKKCIWEIQLNEVNADKVEKILRYVSYVHIWGNNWSQQSFVLILVSKFAVNIKNATIAIARYRQSVPLYIISLTETLSKLANEIIEIKQRINVM